MCHLHIVDYDIASHSCVGSELVCGAAGWFTLVLVQYYIDG